MSERIVTMLSKEEIQKRVEDCRITCSVSTCSAAD